MEVIFYQRLQHAKQSFSNLLSCLKLFLLEFYFHFWGKKDSSVNKRVRNGIKPLYKPWYKGIKTDEQWMMNELVHCHGVTPMSGWCTSQRFCRTFLETTSKHYSRNVHLPPIPVRQTFYGQCLWRLKSKSILTLCWSKSDMFFVCLWTWWLPLLIPLDCCFVSTHKAMFHHQHWSVKWSLGYFHNKHSLSFLYTWTQCSFWLIINRWSTNFAGKNSLANTIWQLAL